jgi:hypothetical protein
MLALQQLTLQPKQLLLVLLLLLAILQCCLW